MIAVKKEETVCALSTLTLQRDMDTSQIRSRGTQI